MFRNKVWNQPIPIKNFIFEEKQKFSFFDKNKNLVTIGQNVPVVFKRENFETERSLQISSEEFFRSSSEKTEDEEIIFESRKTSNSIPRSIDGFRILTN